MMKLIVIKVAIIVKNMLWIKALGVKILAPLMNTFLHQVALTTKIVA